MVARNPTKCHPQSCHHDFTEGESHGGHFQHFQAPVDWINDFVNSVVRVGVKVGCKLKKRRTQSLPEQQELERDLLYGAGGTGDSGGGGGSRDDYRARKELRFSLLQQWIFAGYLRA